MSARIAMATSNKRIAVADSSEDDVMVVAILGRLGRWQKEQELWHHHISSGIMALGRLLAGASAWLEP